MTKKKALLTAALGAATIGIALAGTSYAHDQGQARGANAGTGVQHQEMTAEEIAARQAERAKAWNDSLTSGVTAGKITAEQKETLLAKHNAIQEKMKAGDREGAKQLREELHTWMESNNIDESVMPAKRGGGHGMGMHRGQTN